MKCFRELSLVSFELLFLEVGLDGVELFACFYLYFWRLEAGLVRGLDRVEE